MFRLISLPFLAVLIYVLALPWRAESYLTALETGQIPLEESEDWPLAWEPSLQAARMMLMRGGYDLDRIRGHLEHAIEVRPLYAPSWLELARLEWRAGNSDLAIQHADHSDTLWPSRRRHQWRLGQFYLQAGELDRALRTLSQVLVLEPQRADRVVASLLKFGIPSEQVMDSLAASIADETLASETAAMNVLQFAIRSGDLALAGEWLSRLPDSLRDREDMRKPYLNLALRTGNVAVICESWVVLHPGDPCANQLRNGGFDQPVGNYGLSWHLRHGKGFAITQIPDRGGRPAVRVAFDGSENLNFRNLQQTVPLSGSKTMALRALWSAEDISTRSGLFFEVRMRCGEESRVFQSEPRRGSWDHQEETVEFSFNGDCHQAQVALARNSTTALDRNLAGTVWVDSMRLEEIAQ